MTTLDKLFGSADFVKLLRLFVLNPGLCIEAKEISRRTKVKSSTLTKHLNDLKAMKLVTKKACTITEATKKKLKSGKVKMRSRRSQGHQLNPKFELLRPLQGLLLNTEPLKNDEIVSRFKNSGRLKLVAVSGVFMNSEGSRVDILVVGDQLKRGAIENALKSIEADVGKELEYAVFETNDFKYRLEIYDKFIRDILDYPHRKILNKIGI